VAAKSWIRDVGAAVWRQFKNLWIMDVGAGSWRRIKKLWISDGTSWHQVYDVPVPTLLTAEGVNNIGNQTSPVDVDWTTTGSLIGWTLTIEYKFTSGTYAVGYTGADGGSSPQTIPYWGSAISDPADPGESMLGDGWIQVSLKDGLGNHAFGSPKSGAVLY